MKKCTYCKDPILKFQAFEAQTNRMGKKIYYHKGCCEVILDEIVDKVRKAQGAPNAQTETAAGQMGKNMS